MRAPTQESALGLAAVKVGGKNMQEQGQVRV